VSKPIITDDEIMSLWNTVRPSYAQQMCMIYGHGPYGSTKPKYELRHFAELVIEWTMEKESKQ
jgi:hypothetical protein